MLWSNWRTAILRGALLVLFCWSGIAWTQGLVQHAGQNAAERIMVVHENGKSTRCRVVESWKLPDGRIAHLLQSLETGDYLTIVDDQAPNPEQSLLLQKNPRAMPKRIFPWGQAAKTPPEGSPIPPHLRVDSGLVLKNEPLPPKDATMVPGSSLLNREVDERGLGKGFGIHSEGVQTLAPRQEKTAARPPTGEPPLPVAGIEIVSTIGPKGAPPTPQVLNLPAAPPDRGVNSAVPPLAQSRPELTIVNQTAPAIVPTVLGVKEKNQPKAQPSVKLPLQIANEPVLPKVAEPALPSGSLPSPAKVKTPSILSALVPPPILPADAKSVIGQTPASGINKATALPPLPAPPSVTMNNPSSSSSATVLKSTPSNTPPALPSVENPSGPKTKIVQSVPTNPASPAASKNGSRDAPNRSSGTAKVAVPAPGIEPNKGTEPAAKKSWRFGEKFQAMFQGKPMPNASKPEEAKPVAQNNNPAIETILPARSKAAEQRIVPSVEGPNRAAFSTAMVNVPPATAPVQPAPKSVPLSIAKPTPLSVPTKDKTVLIRDKTQDKPGIAPPPSPDKIVLIREGPKDQVASLSPPGTTPQDKTDTPTPAPKRSMWGTAQSNQAVPPGKSVLDSAAPQPAVAKLPPAPPVRKSDPLLTPELWNPSEDRLKPKVAPPPAELKRPVETKTAAPRPAPLPNEGNWPPGVQSVLAAKNSSAGSIIYVPVPTVTVPQPNHPPLPPEPKLEAPQLTAYVNAFSAPPAPKGSLPNGGMVQPAGYNPMMNPQAMMSRDPALAQQMYQQQMMAQMYQQQMMQQQAMNPYSYRPSPGMMNPYMPANGMMNPMMAQNHAMPAQIPAMNFARNYTGPQPPNPFGGNAPMMPQGMVQPVNYQQPAVSPQYSVAAQVEQTMRVLRESPYPAQREWAAQSMVSFDWRSNPAIVPVLLQSALQDPAPSVRAGCVYTLGRMQAAVEPVYSTLQRLRNDADPRVRQEVEQAFIRLGQPASAARGY